MQALDRCVRITLIDQLIEVKQVNECLREVVLLERDLRDWVAIAQLRDEEANLACNEQRLFLDKHLSHDLINFDVL